MITDREAWEDLGFFEEPDEVTLRIIKRCLKSAESYFEGAVGKNADKDDPKAKEFILMALGYFYENRTLEGKGSGAFNMMKQNLLMQLKTEVEDDEI